MTKEVMKQDEPVAYLTNQRQRLNIVINPVVYESMPIAVEWEMPLYAKPQSKEWVSLTENQIDKLEKEFIGFPVPNIYNFVQAIETKLKEKNGYK
jgi:hypothetical protein